MGSVEFHPWLRQLDATVAQSTGAASEDPFSFPSRCLPGTQEEAESSQAGSQTGAGTGQVLEP